LEEKNVTKSWVKVFWFSLMTIIAVISGLWFVIGWIFSICTSVKLFLLYIPAIIFLSFYASMIFTFVEAKLKFDDWDFLWF